eukprot:TRINITY_DN14711_c0_g1_i1.p1 TRINITY_DN14711_c0_g1~~TRINITY_DN14711_c0_g1_i1.p1  ORF type:complete len:211 (+),score=26.87 TRINITY_DN14711_c0_g1_i1:153-785(+)
MQNQDTGVTLSFVRSYVQDMRKQLKKQSEEIRRLVDICSDLGGKATPAPSQAQSSEIDSWLNRDDSNCQRKVQTEDLWNGSDHAIPALRERCRQSICNVLLDQIQQTCDDFFVEYERSLESLKKSVHQCENITPSTATVSVNSASPRTSPSTKNVQRVPLSVGYQQPGIDALQEISSSCEAIDPRCDSAAFQSGVGGHLGHLDYAAISRV